MGEWSKKNGEYGEKVVETFFSVIGWNDLSKGIVLPCINGKKHLNDKGNPKETHGIDFLYSYTNPLVSAQRNNILISSKYKISKYPNSPTKLFKEFMDDLIMSVSTVRITDTQMNKTIYIMDNKRVAFILEVMKYVKIKNDTFDYTFYYPNTGQNINPQGRQNVGKTLPVEYLNSSIIPIRLENKDNPREKCLFLATIDNFEEDDFTRLMGLSKDITTDLTGEVIIAFPDYNELTHKQIVTMAKQKFDAPEFTKTVTVVNFTNSLNVF